MRRWWLVCGALAAGALVLGACAQESEVATDPPAAPPAATEPGDPAQPTEPTEPPASPAAPEATAPDQPPAATPEATEPDAVEPVEGPQAEDFTLELADGGEFVLSAEQRTTYLIFWAEW